jgi:transposase
MADEKTVSAPETVAASRLIGFRHRVKVKIENGEPTKPLPSQVVIVGASGTETGRFELADEQAELDFIHGIMPIEFRPVDLSEDLSGFKPWQVTWRESKEGDEGVERHASQCRYKTKRGKRGEPSTQVLVEVAKQVPTKWVGLQPGDKLIQCLGGSGDYFAFAASRKLQASGGDVFRIPPFKLQELRGSASKNDDAELLVESFKLYPDLFYPTHVRDQNIIRVRETYFLRMDAMKDRMACAARLRQRLIGQIFCSETGGFPEGGIEKAYEDLKATDASFLALVEQEERALKVMTKAVEETEVWQKLFVNIAGVGPGIAARIITAIIDIRRFATKAKLKAFMGVHVLKDGTFPRRRNGAVANWHPDGRQALFLLADQFIKNPGSDWGAKFKVYKGGFRVKHPLVCIQVKEPQYAGLFDDGHAPLGPAPQKVRPYYEIPDPRGTGTIRITGPQRYFDGHIHKMTIWRTLTRFTERLHRDWQRLERDAHKEVKV